jgi:hypothetical protein
MVTRRGGIVLTLKKANRVEIKLTVWPCDSFHWIYATHNHRRSASIQEHERRSATVLGRPAFA